MFVFRSKLNELKEISTRIAGLIQPVFAEHIKELDEENPRDLIDMLLMNISSEEKRSCLYRNDAEIIIDDLIGGHSALGNMLEWALYLLAGNVQVQEVIREEVNMATANNSRKLQIYDRSHLQYTEATVYEVLRIISSPIIPHVSNVNTSVQGISLWTHFKLEIKVVSGTAGNIMQYALT